MLEIPGILDVSLPRRGLLKLGSYGLLGTTLNQALLEGQESSARVPIRSCILLMLYGGPSHLDTWDMKPQASAEIRGEYQPIQTNVPGRIVCEHLPACSQLMDRMAVIRSMHHAKSNHNSAMYEALIGYPPKSNDEILGANRSQDFPNHGAVINYLTAHGQLERPPNALINVALPHVLHNVVDLAGQNAGFLGGRYDPFQINSDPNQPAFQVRNLKLPEGVNDGRMQERGRLLDALERRIGVSATDSLGQYRQQATELLQSSAVQHAFQIDREPDSVRERYGRHKLGQSMLLARRLVETGVRFINVNDKVYNGQDANWDSHATIFPRHRELLAPVDQALSAFLEDLENRGLLDSTLVVVLGEFGRTPRVNANAGRDHWPDCFSVVLAGGGVKGGSVYGESDRTGAYPVSHPVTPGDLAATLFWRFGVDHKYEIRDALDRPFPIAPGEPIRELFS
jgi:uncharacterized protein (DUF1501 family)